MFQLSSFYCNLGAIASDAPLSGLRLDPDSLGLTCLGMDMWVQPQAWLGTQASDAQLLILSRLSRARYLRQIPWCQATASIHG